MSGLFIFLVVFAAIAVFDILAQTHGVDSRPGLRGSSRPGSRPVHLDQPKTSPSPVSPWRAGRGLIGFRGRRLSRASHATVASAASRPLTAGAGASSAARASGDPRPRSARRSACRTSRRELAPGHQADRATTGAARCPGRRARSRPRSSRPSRSGRTTRRQRARSRTPPPWRASRCPARSARRRRRRSTASWRVRAPAISHQASGLPPPPSIVIAHSEPMRHVIALVAAVLHVVDHSRTGIRAPAGEPDPCLDGERDRAAIDRAVPSRATTTSSGPRRTTPKRPGREIAELVAPAGGP